MAKDSVELNSSRGVQVTYQNDEDSEKITFKMS